MSNPTPKPPPARTIVSLFRELTTLMAGVGDCTSLIFGIFVGIAQIHILLPIRILITALCLYIIVFFQLLRPLQFRKFRRLGAKWSARAVTSVSRAFKIFILATILARFAFSVTRSGLTSLHRCCGSGWALQPMSGNFFSNSCLRFRSSSISRSVPLTTTVSGL